IEDDEALSLFADTIKTLSDHSTDATVMLVGVADSIDELVGDHLSIERPLVQVQMPRMSKKELGELIDKGCQRLNMSMVAHARSDVIRLAEGLPYYAHLLCLHAFQRSVMDDREKVNAADITAAIDLGVQKAQHSIRSAYQKATRSPRKDNLFKQVLLACALAPKDELGYFTASGVRDPMTAIMQQKYEIPAFARHLKEFTSENRGMVLKKSGTERRWFYRFSNPLVQPFVILHSLARGLVSDELLTGLQSDPGRTISGATGP
ncbi:MAG: hypothetical protein IMZ71_03810, partial [Chloroflexi bacterium]|nr:hypothetical protein [Chloroflexota bacterium]